MAEVHMRPDCDEIVAHLDGVVAAVHDETKDIGRRARALLLAHRDEGDAKIEVSFSGPDGWVALVDEAAVSIEYGHFVDNGEIDAKVTYVPGLFIIHRAAGFA